MDRSRSEPGRLKESKPFTSPLQEPIVQQRMNLDNGGARRVSVCRISGHPAGRRRGVPPPREPGAECYRPGSLAAEHYPQEPERGVLPPGEPEVEFEPVGQILDLVLDGGGH